MEEYSKNSHISLFFLIHLMQVTSSHYLLSPRRSAMLLAVWRSHSEAFPASLCPSIPIVSSVCALLGAEAMGNRNCWLVALSWEGSSIVIPRKIVGHHYLSPKRIHGVADRRRRTWERSLPSYCSMRCILVAASGIGMPWLHKTLDTGSFFTDTFVMMCVSVRAHDPRLLVECRCRPASRLFPRNQAMTSWLHGPLNIFILFSCHSGESLRHLLMCRGLAGT